MEKEMINRLKIVLAEEQKSSKWLAEQLGKDRAIQMGDEHYAARRKKPPTYSRGFKY